MAEQINTIIQRVINKTSESEPQKQISLSFWRDLREDLQTATTPLEKEAVWRRYELELGVTKCRIQRGQKGDGTPNRRQRRGSTLDPVKFRPLNREQRARLIFLAEKFDAQTKEPGKHGGCLKRTGLQVLRILLFHFHNVHSGRCDPLPQHHSEGCRDGTFDSGEGTHPPRGSRDY